MNDTPPPLECPDADTGRRNRSHPHYHGVATQPHIPIHALRSTTWRHGTANTFQTRRHRRKGSFQRTSGTLNTAFIVTDGNARLQVRYARILPDLFREGQAIVATGQMQHGTFIAENILGTAQRNPYTAATGQQNATHTSATHPPRIPPSPKQHLEQFRTTTPVSDDASPAPGTTPCTPAPPMKPPRRIPTSIQPNMLPGVWPDPPDPRPADSTAAGTASPDWRPAPPHCLDGRCTPSRLCATEPAR